MTKNIAQILKTDVNIKAKTEEGLGFTGTGQGMAAYAVCLIKREEQNENLQHTNPH